MQGMFDLTGKTAIVTGASKETGLCFAQAQALHDAGAQVVILGGNPENLDHMVAKLQDVPGYFVVKGDLADETQRNAAFAQAVECLGGRLDILVNGAARQHRCPAVDFPVEAWESVIDVNLSALFYLCQLAGKVMLAQGSGKIINMASMTTYMGGHIIPAYTASKAGVAGLTRALSNEWMGHGVQVNAIAPGYMATELTASVIHSEVGQRITQRIPAGRWGTPEDLSGLTVFLASAGSDYMSGVTIPVDGGYLPM